MEARALTRHEKASLKSFLSGVYAGLIFQFYVTYVTFLLLVFRW